MDISYLRDFALSFGLFIKDEAISLALMIIGLIIISQLLTRLSNQFVHEDKRRFRFKKSVKYFTTIIAFLWIIILYNSHIEKGQPLYLFIIGAMLATLAIGMRDLIANIVGWMIIASHKGFQTGDRIQLGDTIGDVIDIGLIRTTIAEIGSWADHGEQSTGRLISVPNSVILTKEIINYNRGFDTMWNEIEIMVTFESNWEKAEHILSEIATFDFEKRKDSFAEKMRIVKRDFMVTYNYISPKVYVTIVDSGVRLVVRHMVYIRERRTVSDEIARTILKSFNKEPDIDFAYNTVRYFNGPSSTGISK